MPVKCTIKTSFKKLGVSWVLVAHAYNPSYLGDRNQEDHGSKPALGKWFVRFVSKIPNTQKRAGGVTQAIQHLPSKCEALSSNPRTTKKNFFK
jgi:hypothetical protein